ncbi:MAG TPA: hypothetical protein H9835_07625 [Candidatus Agathobaculum merdigallinarum]|nr:hypothetical protein [Candidatus Agathobaculum merdigallinarum]
MKRKIILVFGCAVVLCGVLVYLLTPYTVAPQPEQLEIHQVRRVGNDAEYIDVTAQTDAEALEQLLASCKASRLPSYRSGGYPTATVRYEIDAVYQNELLHIVLGESSFAYQSVPWVHMIRNGEEMAAGMDALISTNTTK